MPASSDATPTPPGLSPIGGKAIEARFDAALMCGTGSHWIGRGTIPHAGGSSGAKRCHTLAHNFL